MGLEAGEKVFGVDTNALGFKVPRGARSPHTEAPHSVTAEACAPCEVASRAWPLLACALEHFGDLTQCLSCCQGYAGSELSIVACGASAGWGVLQGDGINIHTLEKIQDAVLDKGYSAEVIVMAKFLRHRVCLPACM